MKRFDARDGWPDWMVLGVVVFFLAVIGLAAYSLATGYNGCMPGHGCR